MGASTSAWAQEGLRLQKAREGRFTYFVDLDTVTREGGTARLRSLQLTDEPILIGAVGYIGGYSWWRFDCEARTALREDYASLREDRFEGPTTPTRSQPYDLAPGGEADELAKIGCGWIEQSIDATSLSQAIALSKD